MFFREGIAAGGILSSRQVLFNGRWAYPRLARSRGLT